MPHIPEPLQPAEVEFRDDGTLFSSRFGDVYASAEGALEQARHVFLGGNGLPQRWAGRELFTIVETGFGAGLNFLATWEAWKASAPSDARLHFVSVEKHPFSREGLARIHERHPSTARLAQALGSQWPPVIPGFHRLHLDGHVTLTLLFGEAVPMLSQVQASADAFYLDGFAPSRNPEMWSEALFAHIARLAAPSATCATYTVAAPVRAGLAAAGFAVQKRQGFGTKRDMLAGTLRAASRPRAIENHALVIGGGLAGTHCAERLAARGWRVDLFESHPAPAQEASGNPAGLIRPVISADWNTHSRFTTSAFLYAKHHLDRLLAAGHRVERGEGGVLQIARNAERFEKQQALVDAWRLPADLVRTLSQSEASHLAGVPVNGAGWWFPEGVWAAPATICTANLEAARAAVTWHFGCRVAGIERGDLWSVKDEDGKILGRAPVLVLANALQAARLDPDGGMPLRHVRGQVSLIPVPPGKALKIAVSGDGYISPAVNGLHCVGASFNEGMVETAERTDDHAGNLERLQRMLPGYANGLRPEDLRGRVSFRTMARDRLPAVGGLGVPGLYALTGLGSRGMTWSALAAEVLASQICGEPLPVEADLVAALDPRRFA
jgi:tRNA 5-methylaminomethyl-2-thiouridine biosynthesis bifunctional protein